LRRRKYFQGRDIRGGAGKDVAWLAPDGNEMDDAAWHAGFVRTLAMLLSGSAIEEVNERGEPITGDTLLVLLNGHTDKVDFTRPPFHGGSSSIASSRRSTADAFRSNARLASRWMSSRRCSRTGMTSSSLSCETVRVCVHVLPGSTQRTERKMISLRVLRSPRLI